jgi:hypothetical protein
VGLLWKHRLMRLPSVLSKELFGFLLVLLILEPLLVFSESPCEGSGLVGDETDWLAVSELEEGLFFAETVAGVFETVFVTDGAALF